MRRDAKYRYLGDLKLYLDLKFGPLLVFSLKKRTCWIDPWRSCSYGLDVFWWNLHDFIEFLVFDLLNDIPKSLIWRLWNILRYFTIKKNHLVNSMQKVYFSYYMRNVHSGSLNNEWPEYMYIWPELCLVWLKEYYAPTPFGR